MVVKDVVPVVKLVEVVRKVEVVFSVRIFTVGVNGMVAGVLNRTSETVVEAAVGVLPLVNLVTITLCDDGKFDELYLKTGIACCR